MHTHTHTRAHALGEIVKFGEILKYVRNTFMLDCVFFVLYVIDLSGSESELQFAVKVHISSEIAYLGITYFLYM